jgi:hypothetical protein
MFIRPGHALAAAALLLTACATTPPEPTEFYQATARGLAAKRGLLLVTSCHLRDEVGSDKILVEPSAAATESMRSGVSAYLTEYGLAPTGSVIRMMCAGTPRDQSDGLQFIPNIAEKDKVSPGTLPHVFGEGSSVDGAFDPITAMQLNRLANDAYTAILKKTGDAQPRGRVWLKPEEIAQLRAATGADYVWVVASDSIEVSGGKTIGTAILTATLTLGTVAVAPTGGRQSMVALIDLENPAVIWRKVDGTVAGLFSVTATNTGARTPTMVQERTGTSSAAPDPATQWAAGLFAPFLAPGQQLAGKGVQPATSASSPESVPATAPAVETVPAAETAPAIAPASATESAPAGAGS